VSYAALKARAIRPPVTDAHGRGNPGGSASIHFHQEKGDMNSRQKQVMESFLRVRTFLDEHPAPDLQGLASARAMLDDVLQRVRTLGGTYYRGRTLVRAEVQRQRDQVALLLDQHIRPIVTIARAQIAPTSVVGLPAALRMPKLPINATRLLTVCDGLIEAAQPYAAVFVANGLAADFLTQLGAARDELERVMGGRASQVGAHVEARQALKREFVRGRRAVERLDALMRGAFRVQPATLSAWRSAKRVTETPGGAAPRVVEDPADVAKAA
jgi:hypothetical protein